MDKNHPNYIPAKVTAPEPSAAPICSSSRTLKKNEYRMWPNGPTVTLPKEYHWDATTQEVVKNDLSWRGDMLAFWELQHSE